MLLDVNYLVQNPGYIFLIAIVVMLLKAVIAGFTISFMGLPLRIAVLVGLALSQIGEFSFILSKVGNDCGLISQEIYQLFLDVAVLTMGATSFLMATSQKVADGFLLLPLPERLKNRSHALSAAPSKSWNDHLIIVGYGVNGRNVARSAKSKGNTIVIVEMDPEIVSFEGKIGEPIYYGDATQENVLQHVNVREARVMVIAISDPEATRRIVEVARRLNFDLFIIARTRYLDEMLPLHNLGANEVIPEEYETSVEIFSRVLKQYDVPRDEIESFIQEVRSDGYEMFRSLSPEPYCDANLDLITDEIGTFRVCSGSPISGRPVADIGLDRHGVKMLAVHRDMKTIANPDESFILKVDDVAILMGPEESLSVLGNVFQSPMMK